jgi:NAD(P)-dependent dehydrogenase (short-subunit alcohol dehydrogenase family)
LTAQPLAGRRVLVTGASGGIGRAVARTVAARGASVTVVARRRDELRDVLGSLPGHGHVAVAMDVGDEEAWRRHAALMAPAGRVDAVVTAAARLSPVGPIGTWSVDEFRATLDVNVVGTLLAVMTFLEPLACARGAVVTFSGGGATSAFPNYDAYAASKAAVVRLTENLAEELRPRGIRCNSIAPGFVLTDMHEATLQAGPERAGTGYYERTRQAVASAAGDPPEAAAELTAFLLSDEARGISGKLISARWDPWREAEFVRRLMADTDLATLRRIDGQAFVARP